MENKYKLSEDGETDDQVGRVIENWTKAKSFSQKKQTSAMRKTKVKVDKWTNTLKHSDKF